MAIFSICILFSWILLGPDEAQYWTWSQALDWGYYSKPPGIAWQIGIGTKIFGQTEWGVRSFSIVFGFFQALLLYELASEAGLSSRASFWSGILMAFCPIGIIGSFLAITDIGFLLCWTAACLCVVRSFRKNQEVQPHWIGFWIALGALFKWPVYFFWIFTFPYMRRIKKPAIIGFCISLLGLLPSLWWNMHHHWATFRHVFATLEGGHGEKESNFFSFIGSQIVLLSPVLFFLLCFACQKWIKKKSLLPPSIAFCGIVTFGSLTAAALLACFQKIQGNWAIFAYPTAIVLICWVLFDQPGKRIRLVTWGFGFSLFFTVILALILSSIYPQWNPFKHNQGWTSLSEELDWHGYDPERHYLFSDKYQTASLLSFYAKGQKRAYFLPLDNIRKNQFSYWPSLQEERKGQTGYFVWVENAPKLETDYPEKIPFYQQKLGKFFENVEYLGLVPLIQKGNFLIKGALIFRCHNCREIPPNESSLY